MLEEKDQNIHLNDEFPLKIASISLQKQNFLGMRFPNSRIFSMHELHIRAVLQFVLITICI